MELPLPDPAKLWRLHFLSLCYPCRSARLRDNLPPHAAPTHFRCSLVVHPLHVLCGDCGDVQLCSLIYCSWISFQTSTDELRFQAARSIVFRCSDMHAEKNMWSRCCRKRLGCRSPIRKARLASLSALPGSWQGKLTRSFCCMPRPSSTRLCFPTPKFESCCALVRHFCYLFNLMPLI